MDPLRQLAFCPPGTPYFDRPDLHGIPTPDYPVVAQALPEGWVRDVGSEWVTLTPERVELPGQGWKIHVSATLAAAERIATVVWDYCTERHLVFKLIRGPGVLLRRNGKYGDRSASGKFVTIYPVEEQTFATILTELGDLLDGEPGPYILSDLRWRSGPLYVRYGAFANRTMRLPSGETVYCIEDPDGNPVPDQRGPAFRPPAWTRLPACLDEAVAERNAGTLADFPFAVTRALHFSNGGGIYRGTHLETGVQVLLREARPHAAEDAAGRDAVARLEREHWAMRQLDGLACIPRLVDVRTGHEHRFLVREYVDGEPLSVLIRRNPLLAPKAPDEPEAVLRSSLADYTRWALGIIEQVEAGITAMHERGVVFADLHPGNIIVRPDDTIAFIDLETAGLADDFAGQVIGTPGFVAPTGYTGTAIDRYALGALKLAVFVPLAPAVGWHGGKADEAIELLEASFPVPADFAVGIRADLAAGNPDRHVALLPGHVPTSGADWPRLVRGGWPTLREELARGIIRSATPDRTDRLYPGNPEQFASPEAGLALFSGAAGVLWALLAAGLPVPEGHAAWLAERVGATEVTRPGLYDGACGIALVLDLLGRRDEARALIDAALSCPLDDNDASLSGGIAGVGLTLLHFADAYDEPRLLDEALRLADRMDPAVGAASPDRRARSAQPLGLYQGATGAALFWLRLYEATGEDTHLARALDAVRSDVAAIAATGAPAPGAAGPDPATRLLLQTALALGGGTAVVADQLSRHRADEQLAAFCDTALRNASRPLVGNAGLCYGQAGMLVVTSALAPRARADGSVPGPVEPLVDSLGLFALRLDGAIAILGSDCLRLSSDLATGAAGVLLGLGTVLGEVGETLPFLRPPTGRGAQA